MGKAADQKLQIRFKNSQRNYQPGDVLTGFVLLNVEDSRQSTSLDLKLCGKAIVAFNRDSSGSDRKQLYASNEYYLEKHLRLWPQGNAGSSTSQPLSAGHHEFPFSFTLPPDIPSSFQSASGNLMYYLKAKLEEGKHPTSAKQFFIVVRPLDLNSVPHARRGVDGEGEKTLCCLCCASGPVSAQVFLPKTGFVPGEAIPLRATIRNNSGRRMTKSYFIVEQVSECYAMGKTDKVSKDFKPSTPLPEHPAIPDGRTDEWTGVETLTVPTVVPTGLEGCGIIDVKHALVLYVVTPGASLNLRVAVDIVIGTVPLRDDEDTTADRIVDSGFSSGSGCFDDHKGSRPHGDDQFQEHHRGDRLAESGYVTSQV